MHTVAPAVPLNRGSFFHPNGRYMDLDLLPANHVNVLYESVAIHRSGYRYLHDGCRY